MFFWIISIILLLLFVTLITRTALMHPASLSIRAFCTRKHLATTLFVLLALLMPLLLHNSNVAAQNDSLQAHRISDKKITPKKISNKKSITKQTVDQLATSQANASTPATQTEESTEQVASQATTSTVTETQNTTTARSTTLVTHSGFTLGEVDFPIVSFSGSGHVPADGNVYSWNQLANHYLIEYQGTAYNYISSATVGATVYVNGQAYRISEVLPWVDYNSAYNVLLSHRVTGGISFQTCETTSAASPLRLFIAVPA
ncbi:hypothetical protein [Loigolactobacillus coryniformis]|uniref:hypothetical protein n=1 Tax=Loigolactobacillus coryniformis TaxID=1610 RepID=UPI00201AA3DE|nr:hypothetical protein [Loigolactobacillus coryniformis]MCL5458024.1 hypothetical protein [Loigolactobacillus coryniformis]